MEANKKYKIVIRDFNLKTKELEGTSTLTTASISVNKLADIVREEVRKYPNSCWSVKPRPKGFSI